MKKAFAFLKRHSALFLLVLVLTTVSASAAFGKYTANNTVTTSLSLDVTAESAPVEWEKVYGDDNAPYEDENGKYYIRYVGDITHRTWVDVTGYGWEDGKILGTEITSTYKMFEKTDDTQGVYWVFLDYAQLNDLNSNMLIGQQSGVSVVYRDNAISKVSVKKPSTSPGVTPQTVSDVSTDILNEVKSVYPNNDVYWWLEQATVDGEPNIGYGIKAYLGDITSVYVPASITSLGGSHTIAGLFSQNTTIQTVMLDPAGTWTSLAFTFQYCSAIKEFPAQFAIPSTVTNMNYTFSQCFGLEKFTVKIPDGVSKMNRTFNLCEALSADITLPAGVTDCTGVARMAGYKEPGLSNLVYDENGNYVGTDNGGKYNIVIRYNGAGGANYGNYGMKYDAEKTTLFIDYSNSTTYSATGTDEEASRFGFVTDPMS